jgi:hypothetical protein
MIKLIVKFFISYLIVLSPLLLAFIINIFSHITAQIIGNIWFIACLIIITMQRPPCDYNDYTTWYQDRKNWWVAWN